MDMNAHLSPSITLRRQHTGLRQKQLASGRPRAGAHIAQSAEGSHGAGSDCVFKRFPAIGDTPTVAQQRW